MATVLFIFGSMWGSSEFGTPSNRIGEAAWYLALAVLAGVVICDVRDQFKSGEFFENIVKRIVIGTCIYMVFAIGSCAIIVNVIE